VDSGRLEQVLVVPEAEEEPVATRIPAARKRQAG
jgi:hypothetical protein